MWRNLRYYFFLVILLFSGCGNLDVDDGGRVEEIWQESDSVKQSMEEGMEENISNEYISTAQLAESEWAKYHNHVFCSLGNYAFYEEILILEGSMEYEVYQWDEKGWKKKGTLQDYLGVGKIYSYIQFERYLIISISGDGQGEELLLADMEDWTYRVLEKEVRADFYIHEGKLLYLSKDGIIMQLELPHGAPEQFEAYQQGEITEGFISHFAIREDGTIVVVKREDDGEVEYWLWKKNETDQWNEKKLMVYPDDWQYVYLFDYNQRGFIVSVDSYNWIEEEERTINSRHGAIQETGEIHEISILSGTQVLPLDNSYFIIDEADIPANMGYDEEWIEKRKTTDVLQYDYEGNQINTYALCGQEIIELGFYLKSLSCEGEKLTGFYCHESTGELYIAQIGIENL